MSSLLSRYHEKKVFGMEELANAKANLLYDILDKYPEVYHVVPNKRVRSRMNICFRISGGDAEAEKRWLKGAEEKGLMGLKGHRSVGGIRCSNCKSLTGAEPSL